MEYSYSSTDNLHALATPDSTVYFGRRDGVGNVIGLVDATKTVRAQYGPYNLWGGLGLLGAGETLSGGGRNRARFKGALWMGDVAPDLYYMRARWYEPRTGRFLSEDPIGLAGGINAYSFASNDAVNGGDASGLAGDLRVRCARDPWYIQFQGDPTWYLLGYSSWECNTLGSDEVRAAELIAATNPYAANGLGSPGGVGGGFVFAPSAGTPIGPTGPSCPGQAIEAAISIAGDIFLGPIKGIRSLIAGSRIALRAASMASKSVRLAREGRWIEAEFSSVMGGLYDRAALRATWRGAGQSLGWAASAGYGVGTAPESESGWYTLFAQPLRERIREHKRLAAEHGLRIEVRDSIWRSFGVDTARASSGVLGFRVKSIERGSVQPTATE